MNVNIDDRIAANGCYSFCRWSLAVTSCCIPLNECQESRRNDRAQYKPFLPHHSFTLHIFPIVRSNMAPKYLYKILDESPPDPLPQTLPTTSLDATDGFIHLSTAAQTAITAKLFFSTHTSLWILKLESQALDGRIDFSTDPKAGIEDGCVHVHDSRIGLGSGNIVDVVNVEREADQEWTEVEGMTGLSDDA